MNDGQLLLSINMYRVTQNEAQGTGIKCLLLGNYISLRKYCRIRFNYRSHTDNKSNQNLKN